jgi:putative ABC transport system permease protein
MANHGNWVGGILVLSRLRWNKVLRDAWRHKARSVLVVMTIAVGVASFGMILAARTAALRDMTEGYWGNVPPKIILYLDPFGVLRAIGATNWTMCSIVIAEGLRVGILSWGLGALLSYPLGIPLSNGMGMAFMEVNVEYVFDCRGVWVWLVVVGVVSVLASLAPARRASRISVREALAYE